MSIAGRSVPVFALILLTTVACETTQSTSTDKSPQLQRLETDMTPDEVKQVLGPPGQTIHSGDAVQWMEYGTAPQRVRIYFEDNRVKAVPERPPSGRHAL